MKGRLILSSCAAAAQNLAVDEAVFESAGKRFPATIRFYGWRRPCFSFGYFCNIPDSLRPLCLDNPGTTLVRRLTGGGWVPHGSDMTFSLAVDLEQIPRFPDVRESYRLIHRALICALEGFRLLGTLQESEEGRTTGPCFTFPVRGDVMIRGRKVAGGAQRRRGGRLLHQGTILLKKPAFPISNPFLEEILTGASGLEEAAGIVPPLEEIARLFTDFLARDFSFEFTEAPLSAEEAARSEQLVRERYTTAEWNLGKKVAGHGLGNEARIG